MVNTEIRLIIFFAAKDGEVLYSQQKQDQELTMTQIMNLISLLDLRLVKFYISSTVNFLTLCFFGNH